MQNSLSRRAADARFHEACQCCLSLRPQLSQENHIDRLQEIYSDIVRDDRLLSEGLRPFDESLRQSYNRRT